MKAPSLYVVFCQSDQVLSGCDVSPVRACSSGKTDLLGDLFAYLVVCAKSTYARPFCAATAVFDDGGVHGVGRWAHFECSSEWQIGTAREEHTVIVC